MPDQRLYPFTFHLLRPFFDLEPAVAGPNMAAGPLLAYEDHDRILAWKPFSGLQRVVSGAFRANLIRETGLKQYAVFTPTEVAPEQRSKHWQHVCEALENYKHLTDRQKVWLIRVLVYLGFHHLVVQLVPSYTNEQVAQSEEISTLTYLRAFSRSLLPQGSWEHYDPHDLEQVTEHGPETSKSRYEAGKALLVFHSKVTHNVEKVKYYRELITPYFLRSEEQPASTSTQVLASAFYRSASFLPMMEGKKEMLIEEMVRAEELARNALSLAQTQDEIYFAKDNFYSMHESRMREAIALGDLDLALKRITEVAEIDPWDSKVHIQRGEILWRRGEYEEAALEYEMAGRYGPPGTALALYMAGEGFELSKNFERACDAYLASLRSDSRGINATLGLARVAQQLNIEPLVEWCLRKADLFAQEDVLTKEDIEAFDTIRQAMKQPTDTLEHNEVM